MDSLISAAARALAAGDALGALDRVALRGDPSALALRGIAMAQLGEYGRARELLRRAARAFGVHEALARARCVVADAEVALAMRELDGVPVSLERSIATLEAHTDRVNANHARLILVRRLVLLGQIDQAVATLAGLHAHAMPPPLQAAAESIAAEVALRALRVGEARAAFARAWTAALCAGIPALLAQIDEARRALDRPAARLLARGVDQPVRLVEVEQLLATDTLVVDGCRRGVRVAGEWTPLTRRPVLFALLRTLAEGWPGDVSREALIARAFRVRRPDESHRARLRVEVSRLRGVLTRLAQVHATASGFVLAPATQDVVVLVPLVEGEQAALIALLADGAAWSTSALAGALGTSQRSVQRALAELETDGRVRSIGQARARRWLSPAPSGITTMLLLPAGPPIP